MTLAPMRRKTWLDMLRILASFLVCYNHSHGFEMVLGGWEPYDLSCWAGLLFDAFTTVNIPLFFMISGALLLDKEESWETLFRKRIFRFLILLTGFSVLIYVGKPPQEASFGDFVRRFLGGEITISYWYLYAYLSFLLVLPFLRRIARGLRGQDVLVLLGIRVCLALSFLMLDLVPRNLGYEALTLSRNFQIPVASTEFLFYPLIGHYLANQFPVQKLRGKHHFLCAGILIGSCGLSALAAYAEGVQFGFTQSYIGLFSFCAAAALFLLARCFLESRRIPEKLASAARIMGSLTLGIYLLEPLVGHILRDIFFQGVLWVPDQILLRSVLWSLSVMLTGGSITWLLQKLPGLKNCL